MEVFARSVEDFVAGGGFAAVAGSTDAAVSEEHAKYVNGAIKSDLSDSLHTM